MRYQVTVGATSADAAFTVSARSELQAAALGLFRFTAGSGAPIDRVERIEVMSHSTPLRALRVDTILTWLGGEGRAVAERKKLGAFS